MNDTSGTNDQTGTSNQDDEGTVDDAKHDTTPQDGSTPQTDHTPQADRPDPTQEVWGSEATEQLPRTAATQQLPTVTREPVDTAVFGAATPAGDDEPSVGAPAPADTRAATPAAAVDATAGPTAGAWPPPVPPRPTGPHAPAIILGLVCLAVAGIVLAQELGNLTVDWGDVGPLGFVAVGAALVVLGAVGLLSSNRRSSKA